MRSGLPIEDLDGFLEEPRVAVLATHWADGSVLLSPVWQEWRDSGFQVWIVVDDVKERHLRRDPRASIVVAESGYPMRAVEVRSTARLLEEDAEQTAVRIASRYIGPEHGRAYVEAHARKHEVFNRHERPRVPHCCLRKRTSWT